MTFAYDRRAMLAHFTSALAGALFSSNSHASSEVIRVGQTSAYSGPFADIGTEMGAAIKAYFEWINRRGEIRGKTIEWITLDDGSDPKRALENAKKLVEERKLVTMLGCLGTGVANALMPYCEDKRIPFFPVTGDDAIRQRKQSYSFFTTASYGEEARSMVRHAATVGLQSVFVIHTDTVGGKGWAEDARDAAQKSNVKFLGAYAAKPDGSNATDGVDACMKSDSAAVLLLLAGPAVQKCLKHLKQRSFLGQSYALSVSAGPRLIKEMGTDLHGQIFTQVVPNPFFDANPIVRDYRMVIESQKLDRNYMTFQGYLLARLFVDCIKRINGTVTTSSVITSLEQRPFLYEPIELNFGSGNRRGTNYVNITMFSKNSRFIS